jgi:hypothetical protein
MPGRGRSDLRKAFAGGDDLEDKDRVCSIAKVGES